MTAACPTPDRLLGFASGELADDAAASVEAHIDDCAECRAALSNLARGDVPPSFGRYRIDTVLGSGGMGIVYRAYDPQLARAVAIKVVKRAADDTTGRARLVREAQALARLSHPNVCHVYDVGTQDDEVWVAMELVDGVSLRQWAGERPEALLDVLLGAAEGIAAAHAAGLVHRDIKPENVLVTREGRAIVTDFGLARHEDVVDPNASTLSTDPHLTATGAIAGTPAYLAPEQLTGDPIDHRVDQFAWAVMAWELLTGGRPFPIIFALRVDAVRAGLTPPPSLARPIAAALQRAMAVAPRDRFPSMRELVDAIRAPAARKRASTLVTARGRAPAIAGLAVLVTGAVAVTAWRWPRSPATNEPAAPTKTELHAALVQPPDAAVPAIATAPPDAAPTVTPPTVTTVAPAPAPRPARPAPAAKTVAKQAAKPASPTTAAAPAQPAIMPGPTPAPAPAPTVKVFQMKRNGAIGTMDAFCHIPYDPAHPDPATPKPIVDWGRISKVEPEAGSFNGEDFTETIITLVGARGTYRFTDQAGAGGASINAHAGDFAAFCADREESDIYHFTGGPTIPAMALFTMSGPPKILQVAKYKPIHINDLQLAASGVEGRSRVTADHRYIVNAKVEAKDGSRWKMDRYWLEVPGGIPGGDLVAAGKRLWIVVENPHYEDAPDGGKQQFVVRAVAVLDDMFP